MSSTNRSDARKQHISDYYVTPVNDVMNFLNEFQKVEPQFKSMFPLLDPCAGGDQFHPMSYPDALTRFGYPKEEIFTLDIREDSLAEVKGDFLSDVDSYGEILARGTGGFKTIITNPPFLIALDIIEKALERVEEGGFVIMLLRLNFLGSKQRKPFWDVNPPKYVFVHHKRMSFTPDNKTDSIEYAHFVWQKGHKPEFTQMKVI